MSDSQLSIFYDEDCEFFLIVRALRRILPAENFSFFESLVMHYYRPVNILNFFVPEIGCPGGDGEGFLFSYYGDELYSFGLVDCITIDPMAGQRLQVMLACNATWSCCSGWSHYRIFCLEASDDMEPEENHDYYNDGVITENRIYDWEDILYMERYIPGTTVL